MSAAESAMGFFDRRSTKDFIESFPVSDSFTLFVGAGASIDRGSPGWDQLVRTLLLRSLESKTKNPRVLRKTIDELTARFDPALLGSSVQRSFEQKYPDETSIHHLHNQLYHYLYEGWIPRESLSTSVALLAVILKSLGRDVHIVTTNYDDNVETAIEDSKSVYDAAQISGCRFVPGSDVPTQLDRHDIPVVHLNGLVSRRNSVEGKIVFSEADFSEIAQTNEGWSTILEYLLERFSSTRVLFVGTSLRDSNVVSALLRSRQGASGERFLVSSLNEFVDLPKTVAAGVAGVFADRVLHLGVEPIFTDFFGQVRQLVKELGYSASMADQYPASRYEVRLRAWKDKWVDQVGKSAPKLFETRLKHQDVLSRTLSDLREVGLIPSGRAKLELWIRTYPNERQLELWSTSESVFTSLEGPHLATIELRSPYESVAVFVKGQQHSGTALNRTSRWQYSFGSVVTLESELQLPVGVVMLLLESGNAGRKIVRTGQVDRIMEFVLERVAPLLSGSSSG
jgi:SIR2-like domain